MKIHCLQHIETETLGNIATWIEEKSQELTKTLLYEEGHTFPDPGDFDLLLIMGGTMSVYQEEEYPWLKLEKDFVRRTIEAGKPILGSCFGAQMLAEVLGGKVSRNRFKEIGWHRVRSTVNEKGNKHFTEECPPVSELPADIPPEFTAFMWHGDTFEIPAGAARLFESEACQNQGFIYNGNVLGLQFHPEADEQWIKNLIEDSGHEIVEGKYIRTEEEMLGQEEILEGARALAFAVMDWFEQRSAKPEAGQNLEIEVPAEEVG
ncbi:TPA: type 1 glutamine amidotransferase [Methanosarcinaceae archaeon]|nr:type 1 glutamine amidotransferase [Methanosarcinaceae archaeon]